MECGTAIKKAEQAGRDDSPPYLTETFDLAVCVTDETDGD